MKNLFESVKFPTERSPEVGPAFGYSLSELKTIFDKVNDIVSDSYYDIEEEGEDKGKEGVDLPKIMREIIQKLDDPKDVLFSFYSLHQIIKGNMQFRKLDHLIKIKTMAESN